MFMRATKAPPRDEIQAATPEAKRGEQLFKLIGCERCHVATMRTAPAGIKINGGTFTIPDALGDKVFHPYSDFRCSVGRWWDRHRLASTSARGGPHASHAAVIRPMAARPVGGAPTHAAHARRRERDVLRCDRRHAGEARGEARRFNRLQDHEQNALIAFLRSL
jgi:CxxC motif-containing protein (DUF1111 family)